MGSSFGTTPFGNWQTRRSRFDSDGSYIGGIQDEEGGKDKRMKRTHQQVQ